MYGPPGTGKTLFAKVRARGGTGAWGAVLRLWGLGAGHQEPRGGASFPGEGHPQGHWA